MEVFILIIVMWVYLLVASILIIKYVGYVKYLTDYSYAKYEVNAIEVDLKELSCFDSIDDAVENYEKMNRA